MAVFRSISGGVGGLAEGARRSVARARLEGEHRSLQRRHAQALQHLGAAVSALVERGVLSAEHFDAELAAVRDQEMLLSAKLAEIEALTFTAPHSDA